MGKDTYHQCKNLAHFQAALAKFWEHEEEQGG